MKKFLVGGLAAAALAVPAVAVAQLPAPDVTAGGSISNSNAGTPRNPTPVTFRFSAVNSAASQTTVETIRLQLPKGVRLDGSNLKVCEPTEANLGGERCASGSKLGTGIAYASIVNKQAPAPNCAGTRGQAPGCITFDLSFFVGGKRLLNVWLKGRAPFSIQSPLTGAISKDARTLTIHIPRALQFQLGRYTALQELSGSWRGVTRKIRGRKYSFVTTTGCPRGRVWSTLVTFLYTANPEQPPVPRMSDDATQRCRP